MKLTWKRSIVIKIVTKHQVTPEEVEDALADRWRYQKRVGTSEAGIRRYQVIGKTQAGRLLRIILDIDGRTVIPVTAFDAPYADQNLYHKRRP